jgi:hypothetical protein
MDCLTSIATFVMRCGKAAASSRVDSAVGEIALDVVTNLALFRHWVRRLQAKNLSGEAP